MLRHVSVKSFRKMLFSVFSNKAVSYLKAVGSCYYDGFFSASQPRKLCPKASVFLFVRSDFGGVLGSVLRVQGTCSAWFCPGCAGG